MKTIEEIQAAIVELEPEKFAILLAWVLEKDEADTMAALAEADAEIERGEVVSIEEARKQLGLR